MNFIAATFELRSAERTPVTAYGLEYISADAVVPGSSGNSEVRVRLLCYNREGGKLDNFNNWKSGTRALVTGNIVFGDDTGKPLDVIITTIECNIPSDMYCNQVVLGNAFFSTTEIKERKNDTVATKIGTTLDNSDTTTWLYLETHSSRKDKLAARIRKGRPCCVQGYLREYRKDDADSPYRAIVAQDFTVRKDREQRSSRSSSSGTAAGYGVEPDPTPDY